MKKDFRYIMLIKYQNDLIMKMLNLDVNECQALWRNSCSQAHHLYSTSISFYTKLRYACQYFDDKNHFITYQANLSIYRAKMNLFAITNTPSPVDAVHSLYIGLS